MESDMQLQFRGFDYREIKDKSQCFRFIFHLNGSKTLWFGTVRREVQLMCNESFRQNLEMRSKIQSEQSSVRGGTKSFVRQSEAEERQNTGYEFSRMLILIFFSEDEYKLS